MSAHATPCARTPELLPVLKEAGVVDAGGRGFTLLLDALLDVVDGRAAPRAAGRRDARRVVAAHRRARRRRPSLRYEVMYLLEADDATIPAFKDTWGAIGDSIVVVGGDGLWNCHVHTDDIGAAVEAGIDAGRPAQDPRHRPPRAGRGGAGGRLGRRPTAATARPPHAAPVTTAVVAVGGRRRGRAAAAQPRRRTRSWPAGSR